MRFDQVRITLKGESKTFMDNCSAAGTASKRLACHNFLNLVMPLRDSDYPVLRVAEAGITYSFPFNVSQEVLILNIKHFGHNIDQDLKHAH